MRRGRDEAISEVLGTILLTGLTIVIIGSFGVVVMNSLTDKDVVPAGEFVLNATPGARHVNVTFVAGTSFSLDAARFALLVNESNALENKSLVVGASPTRFSPGDVLRLNLSASAPALGPGTRLLLLVNDDATGDAIGLVVATLPGGGALPTFASNVLTVSGITLSPTSVPADGTSTVTVTAAVGSTYGRGLVKEVTIDLTNVGGPSDAELVDDGTGADQTAGDGIYTAQFAVATSKAPAFGLSAYATMPITARDALGHTATGTTGTLGMRLPPYVDGVTLATNKFGLGAVSRNIASSSAAGTLYVTNWTWQNETKLNRDIIVFRIVDLVDFSKTWVVQIDFDYCGAPARAGVVKVTMSRDAIPGNAVFTPDSGCFQIGSWSRLNIMDPRLSLDYGNGTAAWTLVGNYSMFGYHASGIGPINQGIVTYSGSTEVTANPHDSIAGIGSADLVWNYAPVPSVAVTIANLTVTMDATASYDVDNGIASYTWNWGDGTPNTTGAVKEHTYLTPGTKTITLVVLDNAGFGNTSSVTLTVGGPLVSYAAAVATDVLGGNVSNVANLARDGGGDVATLTENQTTAVQLQPQLGTDRNFTTPSSSAWTAGTHAAGAYSKSHSTIEGVGLPLGALQLTKTTGGSGAGKVEYAFSKSQPATPAASGTLRFDYRFAAASNSSHWVEMYLVQPNGSVASLGARAFSATWASVNVSVPAASLTDAGSYTLRLVAWLSGNGDDVYFDNVNLSWTDTTPFRFGKEFSVASLPTLPGTTHTLEVRYRLTTSPENLTLSTYDGSTFVNRTTLTSSAFTTYSRVLTASEVATGTLRIRLIDEAATGDLVASAWEIDYIRVTTVFP